MSVFELEERARALVADSVTLRKSPDVTAKKVDRMADRLSRIADQLLFVAGISGRDDDVYSPADHEDFEALQEFQAGRGEDVLGSVLDEEELLIRLQPWLERRESRANASVAAGLR